MEKNTLLNESGRQAPIREGSTIKKIKHQPLEVGKIPSSYFLAAASGVVAISLGLALLNKRKGWANFVGGWVPSLLLLGVYNKISQIYDSNKNEMPSRFH